MTSLLSLLQLSFVLLVAGTLAGQVLRWSVKSKPARFTVANLNLRIASWWMLYSITGIAVWIGPGPVVVLFAIFSILALREYVRLADAGASGPLLYLLVALHYSIIWAVRSFGVWAFLMPVCAVVYLAVLHATDAQDHRFLQRLARVYWGWFICCYSLSYVPALLMLDIAGYKGRNITLLYYLLLVTQLSDAMQYVWGKLLGRRQIAPQFSPQKTWEGFIGGILTSVATGVALHAATPFSPLQAGFICLAVTIAGFLGGLSMSALKRRHAAKDFGSLLPGHGGMLDRADSLCFSAPLFYYIVRIWYSAT